jgi:diguanylate cyclase (GGDEF)-like protein/PAS domain S-box-containing protein
MLLQRTIGSSILLFALACLLYGIGSGRPISWSLHVSDTPIGLPVCFLLVGITILANGPAKRRALIGEAAGWSLIGLAGLSAALTLGAKGMSFVPLFGPDHLTSGMPLYAALSFLVAGSVLVRTAKPTHQHSQIAIPAAILFILAVGLGATIVTALRLNVLYPQLTTSQSGYLVSFGIITCALGLWLRWRKACPVRPGAVMNESERIGLIGGAILIAIAIASGVAGFASQQQLIEKTLSDSLLLSLKNRIAIFQTIIDSRVVLAESIAQRAPLANHAYVAQNGTTDLRTSDPLTEMLRNFIKGDLTGIAVLDPQNRVLASAGRFSGTSGTQVDIGKASPAHILWDKELYLRSRSDILHNGETIGTLEVQQRLPMLTDHLFEPDGFGRTGEMVLCSRSMDTLSCFPRRFRQQVFNVPLTNMKGQPLPMTYAVAGEMNVMKSLDGRGREVIAAYGPVTPSGLGMVVRQETRELYKPMRDQLNWLLPALLLLAAAGALLLRYRVRPLVTRLLDSERRATEKELRMRAIVDNVGEGIVTFDSHGFIRSFNDTACTLFGYTRHAAVGLAIQDIVPPAIQSLPAPLVRRYLRHGTAEPNGRRGVELIGVHRTGRRFFLELTVTDTRIESERLLVGIVRDITERKQAEVRIHAEKEALQATLNSIGDAVGDAVITTDLNSKITYLNPVAENMTGWNNDTAHGLLLQKIFRTVDGTTGRAVANPVLQVLREDRVAMADNKLLLRPDGVQFLIEMSAAPIRDKHQKMIGVALIFRDVTETRRIATQLAYQASHDALTGLINRREFESRLEQVLKADAAPVFGRGEYTLLYLDLDQFKIVNDTCGHAAGDEMLRQLTSVLQDNMRAQDTLARLGGDEFGVLLDQCPPAQALRIADTLRQLISEFRFIWQDKVFATGVSIGLVCFRSGEQTLADLFRMADAACYVAKDKGRNRVHAYAPDDKELSQRHGEMGWIARIRKALDDKRFILYSQKIIPLQADSGEHVHYEMLVRMRDEEGRIVMPMAFIPAAERYGLMPLLDRWVIQTAFAQCFARPASEKICAINLSATSISDEHFLSFVNEQFARYAIDPSRICFEITETAAIANLSQAAALVRELKALGCLIALDDFGSGMSSFGYLKHLPVDYLKIDGGFVKDMLIDPIDHAMVESINHIGHVMGIKTIAEFGENQAIMDELRRIGVDFAQGYGVGKPSPSVVHQLTEKPSETVEG